MRPEIKEYNFDWLLYATLDVASKVADGSEKEYRNLLKYIPQFRGVLETILDEGEPGKIFLKGIAKYFKNIINAHDKGEKVAITTFCFSPAIFYAMGIQPITLEVLSTLAQVLWKRGAFDYLDFGCEVGFTETSCSAQRGSLGAYLAGLGVEIDFVVCDTPGICDTNANAFAFASAYLDKPIYTLNYPQTVGDDKTKKYHRDDFKELIKFLEKQTGNTLKEEKLREILIKIKEQDDILEDIENLQRAVPSPLPPIYNLFIYAGRFLFTGTDDYTKILKAMLKKLNYNVENKISGLKSGEEKARALLVYIDHFTFSLEFFKWLNDNGISHIGAMLSKYFYEGAPYIPEGAPSYSIDTTDMDSMIDSIAQVNAMMPMVKSIRGPYDAPNMWFDDTIANAKLYKADCIIYSGTPGCRNTWGMVKPFASDVEKQGFPMHIMNSDAFDDRVESWETASARLDEFFKVRKIL